MLGALRSGTTLFRLMLNAHERISNPGESDFIFDYLTRRPNSNDWICDIDGLRQSRIFQSQNLSILRSEDGKEIALNLIAQLNERARGQLCLAVHGNADKVAAIFPDCKIIHLIRDPRDVASSCVNMGWAGNTYYGVDSWLKTESNWESFASLFDKNNVMELHFEDLILNTRRELDRVCQFIGVPFSPEMLNYPAYSTYEAPHPSAIQQWKTKLRPREVALVEIKVKSLLLRRNYQLSGYPLDHLGLLERIYLFLANKTYTWRFACRRYGIFNFAMEKITRRLMRPLHPLFVRKMNEITKQYLK